MTQVEMIMPKMGESVAEATIIKWLKKEGDKIAMDETVLEIATDKVDSEIPSPAEGTLVKILFKEGDVVQVGKAIAIIASGQEAAATAAPKVSAPVSVSTNGSSNGSANAHKQVMTSVSVATENFSSSERFYSPLVKNIAKQEGIPLAELERIAGTGKEGRVTKTDILEYIPNRNTQHISTHQKTEISTPISSNGSAAKPAISVSENDEIMEMDRMRKLIADHMVMSKHTSPHVTSFVEVDVTSIVRWRDRVKNSFEKREKEKITFTPIFIEAIARAIKDFPMINVSVDGSKIIIHKNINIGMAAALPSGNLIVPVIKNADQKNLLGLTKSVNDLATRARNSKLVPDEIQGGTFTLTNVGSFGNIMGTPIINQPQVAIMAVGAIKKKPAVIETPQGDTIGIRHLMFLSMSYDHRVVDGSLGGSFIRRVADYLEQFDSKREI
ncbi:MAG: dihydrolipoamide acetyltransferase family protein [Bacteroidia bacterium]